MANIEANGTPLQFRPAESSRRTGDIVIIGAGLAGLFAALRLAPLPVTVVAAAPLGEGASSVWAQGGVAAAVGEGDSPEDHAADTIRAGAGIVDHDVATMVATEASARIADLLRYGVPFDIFGGYVAQSWLPGKNFRPANGFEVGLRLYYSVFINPIDLIFGE